MDLKDFKNLKPGQTVFYTNAGRTTEYKLNTIIDGRVVATHLSSSGGNCGLTTSHLERFSLENPVKPIKREVSRMAKLSSFLDKLMGTE